MALNVSVATTLTRIRQEADIETSDQANSICPDAMLLAWLNDAYRDMFELIAQETGEERFATAATLTAPTFTLPSDFYRELGIDYAPLGMTISGEQYPFAERNSRPFQTTPKFRIQNGAIAWTPANMTPTSSVTLWYIPTPATLASNGSFDSILGWDTYIITYVKLKVYEKQEYDLGTTAALLAKLEARVRRNAARLGAQPEVVGDVRGLAVEAYYNG